MQREERRLTGPWPITLAVLAVGGVTVAVHDFAGLRAALVWVGVAAAASWLAGRRSRNARRAALVEMSDALNAIARGDFSHRAQPTRLGEFASAAAALNRVVDVLTNTRERMAPVAGGLAALPTQLGDALEQVRRSASEQEATVEETASLHASLDASILSIRQEVENLAAANEESSASILELGSCSNEVARSAAALQDTVSSSTGSLTLLGESVQSAAANAHAVELVADETAAAAAQMNQTAREVSAHVQGASELTANVAQRADEGSEAVGATIDGIQEIRAVTLESREALEGLVGGIGAIGEIATVIRSITNETNLLSLNASIIASQAGEHGRAFAVVADQIKELARRTSQSTEQIDGVIASVQQRSSAALDAMAGGVKAVDSGVARSRAAGETLQDIRSAAREASERVAEIARAFEEQGRGAHNVAEAAGRTLEHVQEITGALTEQALSAERLLENSSVSVQMCQQMANAAEEQRAACRDIAANGESISDRIKSIQSATADHEHTRRSVTLTLATLLRTAQISAERIPELAATVETLRTHGEAMAEAMDRVDADADQADASPR